MRWIGFMYSTDADILIFLFFFACIDLDLRAQFERDPESDRLGHPPPPRIMILWRSIESTAVIPS